MNFILTKCVIHLPVTVGPVCLPNVGIDVTGGSKAWITGWGTLASSGDLSEYVQIFMTFCADFSFNP